MTRRRWWQVLGCTTLVLSGCVDAPGDPDACARAAILGGSESPGSIAYDAAVRSTLASILIDVGAGRVALCSGVMLSDHALLTARHCFGEPNLDDISVFRGDPLDPAAPKATVSAMTRHETLDVALLAVDFTARAPVVKPVPLLDGGVDDSWVGARVDLAGYGVIDDGKAGILRFATETIANIEPDHVVVTGHGDSGACEGDSGGPLFGTTPDGRVRVLGLLDDGSADCLGQDRYTRVDRMRDWTPLTSALAHVAPAAGCDALN
jgi:hypothetical protein